MIVCPACQYGFEPAAGGLLIRENVIVIVRHPADGRVLNILRSRNKVITDGLNLIRDRMSGLGLPPSKIAVGDGTADVLDGDHALQNEVYRNGITQILRPATGQVFYRLFIPSSAANGYDLNEAMIVNDDDVMLSRVLFDTPETKTASKTLTVSWEHVYQYQAS